MHKLIALFKKDLRLYGQHFLSLVIFFVLLLCGSAAVFGAVLANALEAPEKTKLAIVDQDNSVLSQAAIGAIVGNTDIAALFTATNCDTNTAIAGMQSGAYDAALLFEENYLSRILAGESAAVTILLSEKLLPASNTVKHFATTGEALIKIAEYGVMSTWQPLREELPYQAARDTLEKIEMRYALQLLSMPQNAFSVEVLPYAESGVGLVEHYLCCFLVFLLFLCEILFFPYTARDFDPPILRRIRSYGIPHSILFIEKAILPLGTRTLLLAAALLFSVHFLPLTLTPMALLSAVLCLILLSLVLSALSILLSQNALGISLLFTLSVAGLFLDGGLLPSAMLPYMVTEVGTYMPSGLAARLLAPLFGGRFDFAALCILAVITAFSMFAALRQIRSICRKGGVV